MATKEEPSARQDAISLLKADHRKVEGLFDSFQVAKTDSKRKLIADQICLELTVHTKIEEDVFYQACEEAGVTENLVTEAHVEHDGAKVLVREIESGEPGDKFYAAKVKVLSEMIKHHVHEEEKRSEGLFAKARAIGLDMDELGQRMQAEKKQLVATYKKSGLPKPETPTFEATELS